MNSKILWSSVVAIGVLGSVVAVLGNMWIPSGPIPNWIAQLMLVIGAVLATTTGILLVWKWSFSIPRWVRIMILVPFIVGILVWVAVFSGFTMFNGTYGFSLNGTFDTCGVSCSVAPAPSATPTPTSTPVAPATVAAPAATVVPTSTPAAPATVAAPAATIVSTATITATMPPSGS